MNYDHSSPIDPEILASLEKATPDLLRQYSSRDTALTALQDFDAECISCPLEIIVMASALIGLHDSTAEHANDLEADGWTLKAEEGRQRAGAYLASYNALKDTWR